MNGSVSETLFSPAKLNLFLAVTGRRADGFHDLVSLVVKLDFGDTLTAELKKGEDAGAASLTCNDPAVPVDDSNLVLKAARLFAAATGGKGAVHFALDKRIPMGAGLGGGSSNGATALRLLNQLAGNPLAPAQTAALAAQLGSDCPLFLADGPIIMRGRGERVTALPTQAAARLSGRRVLLFKPAFGISTPWAYGQLAAVAPSGYLPEPEAEAKLETWLRDPSVAAEALLFNNMEPPAFAKYLALPTLLDQLRQRFGLSPRMSGSGSTCFAFLHQEVDTRPIVAAIRDAWGESAFVAEARLT